MTAEQWGVAVRIWFMVHTTWRPERSEEPGEIL